MDTAEQKHWIPVTLKKFGRILHQHNFSLYFDFLAAVWDLFQISARKVFDHAPGVVLTIIHASTRRSLTTSGLVFYATELFLSLPLEVWLKFSWPKLHEK